jgi:flagellar basal-body rod protein FlgB
MSIGNTTLLNMLETKTHWLNHRQRVLAQNVANADTPRYKARDLTELNFRNMVRNKDFSIELTRSSEKHFGSIANKSSGYSVRENKVPFETSPDGNSVSLEQEMSKIGEVQGQHNLMLSIMSKYHSLHKVALGNG